MSKPVKKFIDKIFRINSCAQQKNVSADKKAKEQKEKVLMMALLSGSIRRVK